MTIRGPLVTQIVRKRERFHDCASSSLLTTLAIVTIAQSLSQPIPRPRVQQPEPPQPNRAMLTDSPVPFAQYDYQNPVRIRARPQPDPGGSLLTFTLPVVDLDGGRSDLSAPWDESRLHARPMVGTQSSPITTLTVPTDTPFVQYDWPVPQRKLRINAQLNWRVVGEREPDPPFVQYDWPVTRRPLTFEHFDQSQIAEALTDVVTIPFAYYDAQMAVRQDSIDAHTLATIMYEPTVPNPFAFYDWPGRTRKREIEVPASASALTGPLNEVVSFPFSQSEWPTIRKVARFQETPQPNLQGLLYVIPTPPFRQTEWPGAQRKVGRFDYNIANLIGTLPPPPIPFNTTDWPNPLRKRPPHFDVWGQSLQHTTIFVENVKPFNQNDWNVGFLFDPRQTYPFISYQPKVIIEGTGLLGLQPPTYVIGTMTTTFGLLAEMSAIGIGVDGEMVHTLGINGSIDTTQGFEGPV